MGIADAARQMAEDGQLIIQFNIGKLAPFGFGAREAIQRAIKTHRTRGQTCHSTSHTPLLMHGGATWDSEVNHSQRRDCVSDPVLNLPA